jgi:hypothetical protein
MSRIDEVFDTMLMIENADSAAPAVNKQYAGELVVGI